MNSSHFHIEKYREERDYEHILSSRKKEGWTKFYGEKKEPYRKALSKSLTYVAYDNSDGYCGYIRCITDGVFTLFCCEIIVDGEFRRMGIGSALIEYVRSLYPSCYVDVLSDNDDFYRSNGFMLLCNGFRKLP